MKMSIEHILYKLMNIEAYICSYCFTTFEENKEMDRQEELRQLANVTKHQFSNEQKY